MSLPMVSSLMVSVIFFILIRKVADRFKSSYRAFEKWIIYLSGLKSENLKTTMVTLIFKKGNKNLVVIE